MPRKSSDDMTERAANPPRKEGSPKPRARTRSASAKSSKPSPGAQQPLPKSAEEAAHAAAAEQAGEAADSTRTQARSSTGAERKSRATNATSAAKAAKGPTAPSSSRAGRKPGPAGRRTPTDEGRRVKPAPTGGRATSPGRKAKATSSDQPTTAIPVVAASTAAAAPPPGETRPTTTTPTPSATGRAGPEATSASRPPATERRRAVAWPIAILLPLVVVALALLGVLATGDDIGQALGSSAPEIVVGTPGGEVLSQALPSATATATPDLTPSPRPTAEPTPDGTPEPTAEPTDEPASAGSPTATAPPAATPAPTPAPSAIIVAVAQPDDAVAAFYRHAAAGDFDAAYSLWSARMKATYPREDNLDGRFDETASIDFEALHVASQSGGSATVQANFVETYDSGSSRRFVGYWELILVDGRWLLDAPRY